MARYPRPKAQSPKLSDTKYLYRPVDTDHWWEMLLAKCTSSSAMMSTPKEPTALCSNTDFMTGQKSSLAEASAEVVFEAAPGCSRERSSSRTFRPNCNKLTLFWVLWPTPSCFFFRLSSLPRGFRGLLLGPDRRRLGFFLFDCKNSWLRPSEGANPRERGKPQDVLPVLSRSVRGARHSTCYYTYYTYIPENVTSFLAEKFKAHQKIPHFSSKNVRQSVIPQ